MTKLQMIAKIENSRFYDKTEKAAEIRKAVEAIRKVDNVIHVLDEKVAPYGYYIPMREIIDSMDDWGKYTHTSRSVLIAELNGCIEIVNVRIQFYNEEDVTVRFLIGNKIGMVKVVKESIAEMYIEAGYAEIVA